MYKLSDLEKAVDKWHDELTAISTAISERDYRLFQKSIRSGNKAFGIIQHALLSKVHEQGSEELKSKLVTTAKKWEAMTSDISIWKDEIYDEYQMVKRSSQKTKSIKNKYSVKNSKTGNNVKIRAV